MGGESQCQDLYQHRGLGDAVVFVLLVIQKEAFFQDVTRLTQWFAQISEARSAILFSRSLSSSAISS